MSTGTNLLHNSFTQNSDSAINSFRPSVEVPREIKINVQRPAVKILDLEQSDTASRTIPQETTSQQNLQLTEPSESDELLVEELMAIHDFSEQFLIHDWQASGFHGQLWLSVRNDSICPLPQDYFNGESIGVSGFDPSQTSTEDSLSTAKESVVIGHKTVEKIEGIEISDPSLVSTKNYDRPLLGQGWFLVTIIALVSLTGLVRLKWQKYLSDVFSAVAFSKMAGRMSETSNGNNKFASFWLGFLFYSNFSLLLFEHMRIAERSFLGLEGWKLLLTLFGFLVIIFSLKVITYRFVGWVFRVRESTFEYLSQSSAMSKAFGVILLPLVVIFPFLEPEARPWVPKIGLAVFIILYVIQIGRGFAANLKNALSGYYIILYLCALEILPLSILYKVLFY